MHEEPGMKFTRYVRKDRRITVPNEVMNALGIKEGDIVEFMVRKIESPDSPTARSVKIENKG